MIQVTAMQTDRLCVFALVELAALREHEQIEQDRLVKLCAEITSDGELKEPVLVDRHTMVVLDGHHRVTVLKQLGCELIPAYMIDYSHPAVNVSSRREDVVVTKDAVVERGCSELLYPPRTSSHDVALSLPSRPVKLTSLAKNRC